MSDRDATRGRWQLLVGAVTGLYLLLTAAGSTMAPTIPLLGGYPYLPIALGATAVIGLVIAIRIRPITPSAILGSIACGFGLATALSETGSQPMRDLDLYLRAGARYMAGGQVYLTAPASAAPRDLADLPFLYPPPTLPIFGLLSTLPRELVVVTWAIGSIVVVVVGLRLIGIRGLWVVPFLLWRPSFDGIWAGNVAPFMFVLFALGVRFGASLPPSALFKVYNGITALWLVRTRRWRQLAVGSAIVAAAVVITWPLTGLASWQAWLSSLGFYRDSQAVIPDLYGLSIQLWVPDAGALLIAGCITAAALLPHDRSGLARLGIASIVASPSLFTHGFLFIVPALALADVTVAVACLAIMSGPTQSMAWWIPVALLVAAWATPFLRSHREEAVGRIDPFQPDSPWPAGRMGNTA